MRFNVEKRKNGKINILEEIHGYESEDVSVFTSKV
jgi:hypothetical protein